MIDLAAGRYHATEATTEADLAAAQRLRALSFGLPERLDQDAFDAGSRHILIREVAGGRLVCCYRLTALEGRDLAHCYSGQYYELAGLAGYDGLMMELGRFCLHPDCHEIDVLRLAWAAMTDFVDRHDVRLLFGCSSFSGIKTDVYLDTFAMLRARHLAPVQWRPRIKAPEVFRFATTLRRRPDMVRALGRMPPLLRSYLMMGGWVSDHAVVDHKMNTLHVFTGVEVGAIPDARKRLLRALV